MAKSEASDYILPIYKDRALKHLVKLAGGKTAIKHLDADQLKKMKSARDVIARDMQFNTLKWFRPFKYQTEFFKTGKTHTRRGMIAANRAGKTIASTYETAYHLTGRYPKNWDGKVWDKPVIAMCSGESWEQVAKTLQSKLLGCDDIKQSYKLGTGSIPLECIDQKSYRTDGANVLSIEIWHASGGKSKLYFSNYTQQVRHLQGFELDLVVLDEQPPDEIFSELVVRTAQRNGQVMCSFTPLKGMSGLVRKFWDKIDGYTHVRVTWNDVPFENEWGEKFFSQEERDQLSRDFMPWERECRMNGIPLVGKGVVFPLLDWPTYKPGDVDLKTNENLERLISFDLGIRNDPTIISFFFRDPVEEIIWLHRQIKIAQGETPDEYVHYLMDRESKGVPIALPHDAAQAGRYTLTEQSVREVFEDNYGLNVISGAILNPANDQGKVTNHKSYGINIMRVMMERGTLRISESCLGFLDEARNYAIDDAGKFSNPDDHIDSARIGILALIQGHGESVVSRANTFQYRRFQPVEGKAQRI
jgi:phage terminase large subunit-like protein